MNNIKVNLDDIMGNSPYIKLTNVKEIDKQTYNTISDFFEEIGIESEFYTNYKNLKHYEETKLQIANELVSTYHYDPTNKESLRKITATICMYLAEHGLVNNSIKATIDTFISDVRESISASMGNRFNDLSALEVLNLYTLIMKGEL